MTSKKHDVPTALLASLFLVDALNQTREHG